MPDDKAVNIKKLTLPDGSRVGIVNLDNILEEVAGLKLSDAKIIKAELLKRVEAQNYVPPSAKTEYATALFREYQINFGEPGAVKESEKPEIHKHTKG
jgi:hypothetical protein